MTEFDFINNLKLKYNLSFVGDDAAVLPKDEATDMLITADMLVEGVDFRVDWTTPEFLGHKALAVSLSDIAAMGGTPKWAACSVAVPQNAWDAGFLDRFYSGWNDIAVRHGVKLVGGDLSRTDGQIVVDSSVIGEVPRGRAVLRSGARPGDAIFVTGFLGGAAAGLKLLRSGLRFDDKLSAPEKHLLFRQLQPLPQVITATLLQTHGLTSSMIDISDGLSSDLHHILKASQVGARIYAEKVPIDPAISAILPDPGENLEMALHGGEDFELLLTAPQSHRSAIDDLGFHCIGEVTDNEGRAVLMRDGQPADLSFGGFRHF